jgi:mono/diheme cytochrome c family protein
LKTEFNAGANVPKAFKYIAVILVVAAMIPPALIARARAVNSPEPRIHYVLDMDNQPKFRAQAANPLFADGRAQRPPIEGTVAWGSDDPDPMFHLGLDGDQLTGRFPDQVTVDLALMQRGQERFNIYCQPCHGLAGYGDGIVNKRAMQLLATGTKGTAWVQPKSLHELAIVEQPIGQLFNTITNGVRNMPAYGPQIPVHDRWAIVAYVKALQMSQDIPRADIPRDQQSQLLSIEFPKPVEETPPATDANAPGRGSENP